MHTVELLTSEKMSMTRACRSSLPLLQEKALYVLHAHCLAQRRTQSRRGEVGLSTGCKEGLMRHPDTAARVCCTSQLPTSEVMSMTTVNCSHAASASL